MENEFVSACKAASILLYAQRKWHGSARESEVFEGVDAHYLSLIAAV